MIGLSLQSINLQAHGDDDIGSIWNLCDGKRDPEILVSTSRNIDRLFPTRVAKRGNNTKDIRHKPSQFEYFQYKDKDQIYDIYDYLEIGRISGLLALNNGDVAHPKPVDRPGLNEEVFMTKLASVIQHYCTALVDEE